MKKLLLMLPILSLLNACGFEIVDTGRRGMKVRFGQVEAEPLPEGLHFYNPLTQDIKEFDVQERKIEDVTECFTKDTQRSNISYTVTYYPDPAKIVSIYKQFGTSWENTVIKPSVLAAMKDAIGQYIADDLVKSREHVAKAAMEEVKKSLAERGVIVTSLLLTNIDFDDAYEQAVEQKVIAVQKAAEAVNKSVEIKERARQTVMQAEADAQAMRIKSQALSQNKGLVAFEAVQKWNGVLPVNMYGSAPLPFLNIKQD